MKQKDPYTINWNIRVFIFNKIHYVPIYENLRSNYDYVCNTDGLCTSCIPYLSWIYNLHFCNGMHMSFCQKLVNVLYHHIAPSFSVFFHFWTGVLAFRAFRYFFFDASALCPSQACVHLLLAISLMIFQMIVVQKQQIRP